MSANDRQVGGDHYQKSIQPWDAIISWGLGFLDGNVVKYMARWRSKGGLEDLKKARHYLDKQIEEEERRQEAKTRDLSFIADMLDPPRKSSEEVEVKDEDPVYTNP